MFISGLANCHLPGLYSLVLSDRQSPHVGMRRVFYCGVDCNMSLFDGADFRLKPHNHRQTLKLTPLFGDVKNVIVKPDDKWGDFHLWRYTFGSALLRGGTFRLERTYKAPARVLLGAPLPERGLRMHWSEVHTVTAAPGSAWLVEEFEQAPAKCEAVYSVNHDLKLSAKGLYEPIPTENLERFERLFPMLKKAAAAV